MTKSAAPLAANISHDFRTPLTVIKEYASILSDGLVGPLTAEQHEFLKVIQDRADDLALLVDNMLDLGKALSGRLRVWRRETSVAEILEPLAVTLREKALLRKASFNVAMADALPAIYADPDKLGRIVANLFADAVKHCLDQPQLLLWARRGDDPSEVVVGLTDNRPQLAHEEVEAMRQRLRSVRKPTGKGKGAGVGLQSAYRLVEAHFGRIGCGMSPDGGASLFVALPVREPAGLLACWSRSTMRYRDQDDVVSVWSIQTAAPVARAPSSVIDEFLQNAFRRRDLVLRVGPGRWLLASRLAAGRMSTVVDRVQRRWAQVIDKRWTGALPPLLFAPLGVWPMAQSGEIVRHFETEPCESQVLAEI